MNYIDDRHMETRERRKKTSRNISTVSLDPIMEEVEDIEPNEVMDRYLI
jgi:hypothetical protein